MSVSAIVKAINRIDSEITKRGVDARKANIHLLQLHIDKGERLNEASNQGTLAEVQEKVGVAKQQAFRLRRLATHKEQALHIAREEGIFGIEALQPLLPNLKDAPIELPAEPPADARPARNSNDWHTPAMYLAAVREVLGDIQLDPFSSVQANERVRADRFFTVADNALEQDWTSDTLFMNPPYGNKKAQGTTALEAVTKFIDEYVEGCVAEAIVLTNLAHDTQWSKLLDKHSDAVCTTDHRISFEDAGGKKVSGNTKSQSFYYFGHRRQAFRDVFRGLGVVWGKL